ncbi:MAG: hypothetical protein K2K98_04550 [Muribaculaceae bacterium]|nr:hypothetical protein [Muribaculaceae bacterium]
MNPNELESGDYVDIFIPKDGYIQLAEVISLDRENMKMEILPQNERNRIVISTPEQWQSIRPHSIFCQDLRALGFNETSLETAYGWTSSEWIKISINRKYVFHLFYEDGGWRLETHWISGMMQRTESADNIHYIHQLQYHLKQYNN